MIDSKYFRHLISGKEVSVCSMMRSLVPMNDHMNNHMDKWNEKRIWADIITTLPRFG